MLGVLTSERWPWWLAGILIGLWVPLCYLVLGRGLGVSGGFAHVCALVTRRGPFSAPAFAARPNAKATFLAGLVLGGLVAAATVGKAGLRLDMGLLTQQLGYGPLAIGLLVIGGFLVGFGTRLAGGCTSGHGITGSAELDPTSFIAMGTFMAVAIGVAHLLRVVLGV